MTRLFTFLLLVLAAGCQITPKHQANTTSDPELWQIRAALDKARTQTDMNLASKKISEFWDAKLASVEKRIEGKLDEQELKRFSESKSLWQRYRMEEVKFRTDFFAGGSIQPLIANTSYSQITEHRVTELESLLVDALEGRP